MSQLYDPDNEDRGLFGFPSVRTLRSSRECLFLVFFLLLITHLAERVYDRRHVTTVIKLRLRIGSRIGEPL